VEDHTQTVEKPQGEGVIPMKEFLGQTAILELEPFPSLRHVTLRWDPPQSLLRRAIENE